jgi:uncharacterized protein (DUF2147 family)
MGAGRIAVVLVATCGVALLAGAQPPSATGSWLADNGLSHVEIAPCGDKLCGSVTWLKSPLGPNGQPLTDSQNPDPSLRSRPLIGVQILQNLSADDSGPGQWEGGTIYDPASGKTYQCTITLQDANTLRVHGYVGSAMFGRTQIWTRAN